MPRLTADPVAGRRLGDFELIREIGRGGMGIVFEAHQLSLDRRVALKVLLQSATLAPDATERFEREARAAGRLHHTNIVAVHAIGREGDVRYYAAELVDGVSLADVLNELREVGSATIVAHALGVLRPREDARAWCDTAACLVAEVADALDCAHRHGVIHRDVKPANLLLSREGRLSVTDFGLARLAEHPALTTTGRILGTPAYMAPEQVVGGDRRIDARTDVYALGAVLYEMLSLERPFSGDTPQVLHAILNREPVAPRTIDHRIPVDLETIALKALEKDPKRRYTSAAAMAADLHRYLDHGLVLARRASPLRRVWKLIRRHPVAATAGAAIATALVLGGLAFSLRGQLRASDVRGAIAEARLEHRTGRLARALEAAEQALALDPRSIDAKLLHARLLVSLSRTREAATEALQVLDRVPDDWTAHAILAAVAFTTNGTDQLPGIDGEPHRRIVEAHAAESADAYYLRALSAETVRAKVELLNRAVALDPGHAEALFARANANLELKDLAAALRDSELLLSARPGSSLGHRMRSRILAAQLDLDGAGAAIDQALTLEPDAAANYAARAELKSLGHLHNEAILDAERAVGIAPTDANGFDLLSEQERQAGRLDAALEHARRATELAPDSPRAYRNWMEALWSLDRRDELRSTLHGLRSAADQWANRVTRAATYRDLVEWWIRLGDLDEARLDADRAVAAQPGGFRGLCSRARVSRLTHGDLAAKADCEAAARIELETPVEFVDRAFLMWWACGMPDDATKDCGRAIELAPHWAEPYWWRSKFLARSGRIEEALADATAAVERQPRWAQAVFTRGEMLRNLDRLDEAIVEIERALVLVGESARTVGLDTILSDLLVRVGRDREAFELLDREAARNPGDGGVLLARALRLFDVGRIDDAIPAFGQAVDAEPGNPWNYVFRALALTFVSGGCGRAKADLDRAAALGPLDGTTACITAWTQLVGFAARCPELFDAERALYLAREGARLQSVFEFEEDMPVLLALYRTGRYSEALTLYESWELHEAPEMFIAALSYHRLGRLAEASRLFEEGRERTNRFFRRQPICLLLEDEAARALGVEPAAEARLLPPAS